MTLSDYLADRNITETAFAALVGVDQSTVHRLRAKGQIPNKDLMAAIFEKTDGLVTANDFFGLAPAQDSSMNSPGSDRTLNASEADAGGNPLRLPLRVGTLSPNDIEVIRERRFGWEQAAPKLLANIFGVSVQRINAICKSSGTQFETAHPTKVHSAETKVNTTNGL